MSSFEGVSVLVTGGSRGIGLALAQRLVDEGAQVAICGRKEANLEAAQAQLGGEVLCVAAHVAKADQVDHLFEQIEQRFGGIDVVIYGSDFMAGMGEAMQGAVPDMMEGIDGALDEATAPAAPAWKWPETIHLAARGTSGMAKTVSFISVMEAETGSTIRVRPEALNLNIMPLLKDQEAVFAILEKSAMSPQHSMRRTALKCGIIARHTE